GMFEEWMGPDLFRRGVQGYLKAYSDRNATAGDFLDSLSSAGKKDVTGPFSTFLNQAGIPLISVSLDCTHDPTLHLSQSRFFSLAARNVSNVTWSVLICVL